MAQANDNQTYNEIIKNVELYWAKLKKAVSPFGEDIYDLQIRVPMKRKKELEAYGKVREIDDMAVINVRKKAFKSDGSPAKKVEVVRGDTGEAIDPDTIGNGSIGNVRLMLRDYQIVHPKTKKVTKEGTAVSLSKVQVTRLIKFTPQGGDMNDFDEAEFEEVENEEDNNEVEQEETPPQRGRRPARQEEPEEEEEAEENDEEEQAEEEEEEEEQKPARRGAPPKNVPVKKAAPAKKPAVKAPMKPAGKKSPPVKTTRRNSDY